MIALLTGCTAGGAVSADAPMAPVSSEPSATRSDATHVGQSDHRRRALRLRCHPLPEDQTCFDSDFRIGFGIFKGGSGNGDSGDLSILSGDPSGIDQVIVTIPAETIDGRPASYIVAPGDLIDEVAGRFGISVDDLFYLNNSRQPNAHQQSLRVGERLNLLLADR